MPWRLSVCLSDISCWESVLNKESSTCLSSCVIRTRAFLRFSKAVFNRKQDSPAVPTEERSKAKLKIRENPYVTCLAKCLGTTPEEIRKVYHECKGKKDVVNFWHSHFGEKSVYCLRTCKPKERFITESVSGIERRETDSFIACFGKCLHLPPTKANDIYKICDENLTCWNNYVKNMTELRICWIDCLPIEELGVEFQRSFDSSPDGHQGYPGGSVRSFDSSPDDHQGYPGGSVRSFDSSQDGHQGYPGGSVRSFDSSPDGHQGYPGGSVRSFDSSQDGHQGYPGGSVRSFDSSPDSHQGYPGGSVRSFASFPDDHQGYPGGSVRSFDSSPDDHQGYPGGSVRSFDSSPDDHQGYPGGSVRSFDSSPDDHQDYPEVL